MLALLRRLEMIPSAFAVEEPATAQVRQEVSPRGPRRSWPRRLATFSRQALDAHRRVRDARGVAAW